MIKFALDEYGDFEGIQETKGPVFIGGILYDEKGGHDYTTEAKRIKAYYQKAIEELNSTGNFQLSYPQSLHVNGIVSPGWKVGRVKEKVKATIGEFLEKGTYSGKPLADEDGVELPARKGQYSVFVVLKSDQGKPSLLEEDVTDVVRDDVASNLYYHIARDTISRVLFHNPSLAKSEEFNLDIATRCIDKSALTGDEIKKYNALHYQTKEIDTKNGRKLELYSLTNADVYRTILAEELEKNKNHPKVRFYVRSISYSPENKYQEYLYLADSVCSLLSFGLPGDNADEWLIQIRKRLDEICGKDQQYLFAYDTVDTDLARIYTRIEENDYFGALSELFDAEQAEGTFAEYYKEKWYPYLKENLAKRIGKDSDALEDAITRLGRYTRQSNINQRKLEYIFKGLEEIVKQFQADNSDVKKDVLYLLNDAGISAYCHLGNSKKADEYFQKCIELKDYIDTGMLIRTFTKYITNLCDMFLYEEASHLAEDLIDICKMYDDIKYRLSGLIGNSKPAKQNSTELAKAYSLYGQTKAFLRQSNAEDCFLRALELFDENAPDYRITQSYLLQFYLDNKKEEEYRKESLSYFSGAETVEERLTYVEENGLGPEAIITFTYAMYVLIRQIYSFDPEEFHDEYFERFHGYFKEMKENKGGYFLEHPVEIINKYLQLIALAKKQPQELRTFRNYDNVICENPGLIIRLLTMFGTAQIAQVEGNIEERNRILQNLDEEVKETYPYMSERVKAGNSDELFECYGEIFTFMYC